MVIFYGTNVIFNGHMVIYPWKNGDLSIVWYVNVQAMHLDHFECDTVVVDLPFTRW